MSSSAAAQQQGDNAPLLSNGNNLHYGGPDGGSSTPTADGLIIVAMEGDAKKEQALSQQAAAAHKAKTGISAGFYVASGVTQPLIMTLCKDAGLANRNCQLYMLFYYMGPASVSFKLWHDQHESLPSWTMILRAGAITIFDITAQALNYTGAALAGPTIFAIVYSSVTVWTAVFSRLVLKRTLIAGQWIAVFVVFGGLVITVGDNSIQIGSDVLSGLLMVICGSAMHGLTYVLCEVVMVVGDEALNSNYRAVKWLIGDKQEARMTVVQNCAIQGFFAMAFMLFWQIVYTWPHYTELIAEPMEKAGTTLSQAAFVLGSFAVANLIHALSYFFTLRHFPGGATSAGVMKGLQAVLVFLVTDYFFCGKTGGIEMCFTEIKLASLLTVVGGVSMFGFFTEKKHRLHAISRSLAEDASRRKGTTESAHMTV